MIKIVADNCVPFLEGVFEPYAEVVYLPGKSITPEIVKDADALIIRTQTKCNKALLKGSKVKMISTATIGTDHIDVDWCDRNGILVRNAAGCNAGGVMQYVFSALYGVAARKPINITGLTMGIIGVGNVGKRVESMARALGFRVLLCDPPRAAAEGEYGFCRLETVLKESDIITLHVPLNESTHHLADKDFFNKMKNNSIFINASRGEVVDENALIELHGKFSSIIIDTWENEPYINLDLMNIVDIATPHIAGYSYQGKLNGTAIAVRAVAYFFGISKLLDFYPQGDRSAMEAVKLDVKGKNQGEIAALLQYNYPIFTDDFLFRLDPLNFERYRNEYHYRKEIFVE